ncbi:MAG: hypothetical protein WCP20_20660 [Desulfuromonadales bacterium]
MKITIADLYRQYISGKKTPLADSTVYACNVGDDVTGGCICMNTERLREPMQKISDRITELVTAAPVEDQERQA